MSEDYLFDGRGGPDPDVARLEQMLGRLRSTTTAPQLPVRLKPDTTETGVANTGSVRLQPDRRLYLGARFLVPALAAAAAIVLMVVFTRNSIPAASWEVAAIAGTPQIGAGALVGEGRIAVGQTLTTDAGSRAKMQVGDIGEVTVDEASRVRLVETSNGRHRLALERGTLHAAITAPPGQFVVDTPSATATDLGCIYSLHVDEDGSGMLSVEVGWVAFEEHGRESFVPAGASSRTDRINGPGTPRYDDTDQEFREAIDDIDRSSGRARKTAALRYVLGHARGRDAMTLWHLIPRVGAADRAALVDALSARVPMPASVPRDAVLRLDRAALDQWWDTLGLDEASWWRKWKQPLPAQAAPVAHIKDTVRLTVTGSGIAEPLEITNREVLALSNVFGGTFIGAPAGESDAAGSRYVVTFDIKTYDGVRSPAYTIDYVKSRWTGDGFIYLPGRGTDRYRINVFTILRDGMDGSWHRAADAWSAAINPLLP